MTLRYLLDTCVVSSPVSKIPNPGIVSGIEEHGHECAVAAPVWHELIYGCRRLPRGQRRSALERYLEGVVRACFPVHSYDVAAAEWHGRERARLDAIGRPAPFVDGQIAAIAAVNGLILVTTNTGDYTQFSGIEIEDWAER
jgi:tRNA(fMet)-specific endonuclease VapC